MIPADVAEVRKRYRLRREEFAAKTRLGEASLARWESGQLIQNAAYDNYLYLLTFEENMRRLEERTERYTKSSRRSGHQEQRKNTKRGSRKR